MHGLPNRRASTPNLSDQRLEQDGPLAGSAFETFAVTEVVRQASYSPLGLSLLRDRLSERFRCGILLHAGGETLPLAGLWHGNGATLRVV